MKYRFASIAIENFKRFQQLDLKLGPFDLLVGPNNSGKSTVLEACRLFDFCYRSCLRGDNGTLHFAKEVPVTEAQLPIAGELEHKLWDPSWLDRQASFQQPLDPEADGLLGPHIALSATLRHGEDLRRYSFELKKRWSIELAIISGPQNSPPISATAFGVVLIPGYVGFQPREERRGAARLRALRAEGQYREIIRNVLLDLKRDERRWHLLSDLLREVFPDLSLLSPEYNEQVNSYIRAPYEEQRDGRTPVVNLDLFAAGSGFHQFVQVFAALFSEDAPTILLDEPDAHLFSKLQGQLYKVLRGITDSGYQVLAATHSPELIAAASPAQIISFANGTPRRLQVHAEVASTARSLGALENLSLLLIDAYGQVLVVEDHSDEDYVKWWLEALLPAERWRRLAGRLIFLHGHRRPSGDQVNVMLDTIESTFAKERDLRIRAFVFADRDYRLDAELRAEGEKLSGKDFHRQRWHVWQRVEIENYLLSETAFEQVITSKAGSAVEPDRARVAFAQAVEMNREQVRDQLMNAYGRHNREQKAGWESSTIFHKAEADLKARWQGPGRCANCDAKIVLGQLYQMAHQQWGVRITDRDLIQAIVKEGADPEMIAAMTQLASFFLDGA